MKINNRDNMITSNSCTWSGIKYHTSLFKFCANSIPVRLQQGVSKISVEQAVNALDRQ